MEKTVIAGITAAVGTGYLASPIDLIPDFLIGVGQVDDIIMYFKIFAFTASKLDTENWMAAMGDKSPMDKPQLPGPVDGEPEGVSPGWQAGDFSENKLGDMVIDI